MNKQQCIEQLQNLKANCSYLGDEESWNKDVEALEMAIEDLKETTHGVEVQEQSLVINLKSNVIKKFDFQELINQQDNTHIFGHRR